MVKCVVVLPTYNEAQNLPRMVESLLGLGVEGLEVLVVDDASPDGTGELAEGLAGKHPGRVHVMHRQGKLGLGSAYRAGFQWALANGAGCVVQMDTDFSHPLEAVPVMVRMAGEYDVVIGSRYVPGGRVDPRWSFKRRALSSLGNLYARVITGVKARDVTAGFKCWSATALKAMPLALIRSEGFTFQVEMNYVCKLKGLRVGEVPILFAERARGKSKMSVSIILEGLWRVWQMRFRKY